MNGIFKELHDEVKRISSERKERLSKFLTISFGIPEAQARNESVIRDLLEQIIREDNPIIQNLLEDAFVFLSEKSDEDIALEAMTSASIKNPSYNRNKAKEYIDKYWNTYNPSYPSFHGGGGDCANFVSQILYAGGMKWQNENNPENYIKAKAWYCKPGATNKDGDRRISFTWKIAASFKNHWLSRAAKHIMMSNKEAKEGMNEIALQMKIGDVVQYCYADGKPWHTLAVTDITSSFGRKDIILASHTYNSNTRSLSNNLGTFPSDYKIRFYIIKA